MRRVHLIAGIGLIVGHFLTEAHSIIRMCWPSSVAIDVGWFWRNIDFKLNILWWIKMVSDDILWCAVFFLWAQSAKNYSAKLHQIVGVYLLYHVADLLMFFYDYKQSTFAYWGLTLATIISTLILLRRDKDTLTYRSLT